MSKIILKDDSGKKFDFIKLLSYQAAQFDMNDNFFGIRPFNGVPPKNSPQEIAAWGFAFSIPLTKIKPNTWIKNAIVFKALKATSLQISLSPSANVGTHVGSYMLNKGSMVLDWNYSLNDIKSKLGG
ncbi:hypothetical protein [Lactobacillus crispatus]|uniref:Uncharacterized protein n=1 Tax=Lactobacillus crispatus TaxID=47770 RepID=A0A7H9E909_9LACO|nr:hypothetical protein [Lactobacillus crispatus]QLL73877.1 hypothetical protein GTO85_05610 [Lactobacillus crispatus]